jgi:hypothetical protein
LLVQVVILAIFRDKKVVGVFVLAFFVRPLHPPLRTDLSRACRGVGHYHSTLSIHIPNATSAVQVGPLASLAPLTPGASVDSSRAHHIWNAIHTYLTVVGSELTNLTLRATLELILWPLCTPWLPRIPVDSFDAYDHIACLIIPSLIGV